jgi:hypothetical protein
MVPVSRRLNHYPAGRSRSYHAGTPTKTPEEIGNGMARIEYDDAVAAAFQASRHLPTAGLGRWRRAVASDLRRDAHTPLKLITDAQYEAGLARLRAAAGNHPGPVIDTLDLLVLRRDNAPLSRRRLTFPAAASDCRSDAQQTL